MSRTIRTVLPHGGKEPLTASARIFLAGLAMSACMDTPLELDEEEPPIVSVISSASHVGGGTVAAGAQESDTHIHVRTETLFPPWPYESDRFDWYLVYPNGYEFLAITEGDEPHLEFNFAKNQYPPGEYWIAVTNYVHDSTSSGCSPYPCNYYISDTSDGFTVPLLASTPDVGVIPNGSSCPSGTQRVSIFMDNEDSDAASSVSGWVGATVLDGNRNTNFVFCRVNGNNFRSLASYNSNSFNYAVLRLGASCPPGSIPFSRHFDNEDYANTNSWSGNIAPNLNITGNTTMHFCLFAGGGTLASKLPSLGFSYGVFASSSFLPAALRGNIHTDDEDHNTANGYTVDAAWASAAQAIVKPMAGDNTTLYTAKAIACNDNRCSYGETPANCYADCDTCNNGICRANETVYNCWQDCGYCNDGVCSPDETATSCPSDCGSQCLSLQKGNDKIPCP